MADCVVLDSNARLLAAWSTANPRLGFEPDPDLLRALVEKHPYAAVECAVRIVAPTLVPASGYANHIEDVEYELARVAGLVADALAGSRDR
jgi:hypothetical protein